MTSKIPSRRRGSKSVLDQSILQQQTLAVRAGQERSEQGEHAEAMYLTSSYVFESCSEAAERFTGDAGGNVYSRYTNPTVRNFETRLAALEGAEDCIATASGMAAIMSVCMAHLRAGDHVVCSKSVFGSTIVLLNNFFAKFDIAISYVALTDVDQWRSAMTEKTRLLFLESPSNPMNEVGDIAALGALARDNDCLLVVDNCFCTPALQQPLSLGAHLAVHSATKYIDGQGRCLGGAVAGSAEMIEPVRGLVRAGGPTMSAFNAWVFLKGLETLSLRMQAHSQAALQIATWLDSQHWVERVHYAGLASHPQHALAAAQQSAFGGVLAFEVVCGDLDPQRAAWQFVDGTELMSLTANLGDAKTTIVHPATTTHGRLSPDARAEAGISDNLIRIAVGLDAIVDIQDDLLRGATALGVA